MWRRGSGSWRGVSKVAPKAAEKPPRVNRGFPDTARLIPIRPIGPTPALLRNWRHARGGPPRPINRANAQIAKLHFLAFIENDERRLEFLAEEPIGFDFTFRIPLLDRLLKLRRSQIIFD